MKRIVVAGIDTNVGKTVVSAILTEALGAHYWKPIQCGAPLDREWVEQMTSRPCYPEGVCLRTPCSPHLAARIEGVSIGRLEMPVCTGPLVIEGAGGILAPLNETKSWIDAALHWEAQWVLVHRHYLGSLNHFLLTAAYLQNSGVPLLGVVFNGEGDLLTEEMLLKRAKTRCIGRLKWHTQWTPELIRQIAREWNPLGLRAI